MQELQDLDKAIKNFQRKYSDIEGKINLFKGREEQYSFKVKNLQEEIEKLSIKKAEIEKENALKSVSILKEAESKSEKIMQEADNIFSQVQ